MYFLLRATLSLPPAALGNDKRTTLLTEINNGKYGRYYFVFATFAKSIKITHRQIWQIFSAFGCVALHCMRHMRKKEWVEGERQHEKTLEMSKSSRITSFVLFAAPNCQRDFFFSPLRWYLWQQQIRWQPQRVVHFVRWTIRSKAHEPNNEWEKWKRKVNILSLGIRVPMVRRVVSRRLHSFPLEIIITFEW